MLVMIVITFVIGLIFTLGLTTYDRIDSEIEIDASAEEVWNILSDFESYSDWNPLITKGFGEPTKGALLDLTFALPFSRSVDIKAKIESAVPGKELVWIGQLLEPKILDGTHSFKIETIGPRQVKLIQEEKFSGLLLYIALPFVKGSIESGFKQMNQILKDRVEGRSHAQLTQDVQPGTV